MPPKPPAPTPKKSASGVAGPSFPLAARATPVVVKPLNPIKQRNIAVCGTDFLLTLRSATDTAGIAASQAVVQNEIPACYALRSSTVSNCFSQETLRHIGHVKALAAGARHVLVLTDNGLFGAGANDELQLGIVPSASDALPLAPLTLPRMSRESDFRSDSKPPAGQNSGLAPPPKIIGIAAGANHSVVLVLRTAADAFFDRPDDQAFVPCTQVYTCGAASLGALGHRPRRNAPRALDAALDGCDTSAAWEAVSVLEDQCIDAVWAAKDLTFARGAAGLYLWGSMLRRFRALQPCLVFPSSLGVVRHVTATASTIAIALQSGEILTWTPALGVGDLGQQSTLVYDITHWKAPFPSTWQTKMSKASLVNLCAGQSHFAALFEDGQVLTWGDNGFGQCGVHASSFEDLHFNELIAPRIEKSYVAAQPTHPSVEAPSLSTTAKQSKAPSSGTLKPTLSIRKQSAATGSGVDVLEQSQASHQSQPTRPASALDTLPSDTASLGSAEQPVSLTCGAFATIVQMADGSLFTAGNCSFFGHR